MFVGLAPSSARTSPAKPGIRIFEILLERYQIEPNQCLFIDDSIANTKTARELGITAITFKGSASCYQKINSYI